MKPIPKILGISSVLSFFLLLATARAPGSPSEYPAGFPFTYKYPNPPTCGFLNPLNGCGYSYDPIYIGLDYLFWLAISTLLVSLAQLTSAQLGSVLRKRPPSI